MKNNPSTTTLPGPMYNQPGNTNEEPTVKPTEKCFYPLCVFVKTSSASGLGSEPGGEWVRACVSVRI